MRKNIILLSLSLFIWGSTYAQESKSLYGNSLKVEQQNIAVTKDNKVDISLLLKAENLKLPSRSSLTLTPVIKDAAGNEKALPQICINGSNRQKVHSRANAFGKTNIGCENAQIVSAAKELSKIDYKATTPYEAWMKNAHLYLKEDHCGCADTKAFVQESDLGKIFSVPSQRYIPKPNISFITPKAEAVKNRNESSDAYLDFQVGKYDILPEFRRNPAELAKVENMIKQVSNDKNISISSITFIGKASPEGSFESNKRLSQNRAKALQDYMAARHKLSPSMLETRSLGEDWVAFESLVRQSDINMKEELLNIINGNDAPDKKESKIRALDNGSIYKYLNENIFPQLRRVESRIDFTVRAFSPEEGRTIITTHPQQMSLNEMFLVANTYEKGSQGFNQVFDIAVRMFPNDDIANNNAAAAAILGGDMNKARNYLAKCKPGGEYYNNMGLIHLMENDLDKAEECLNKAKDSGVSEAIANLKELQLKKEDNKLFSSFGD